MSDYTIYTEFHRVEVGQYRKILGKTTGNVDWSNGRAMAFPEGVMVVIWHENMSTFCPYEFRCNVGLVPTQQYYPLLNPEDGDDAIIGYYTDDLGRRHEVQRKPHTDGDWIWKGYKGK